VAIRERGVVRHPERKPARRLPVQYDLWGR
jgi:hypothetical protein